MTTNSGGVSTQDWLRVSRDLKVTAVDPSTILLSTAERADSNIAKDESENPDPSFGTHIKEAVGVIKGLARKAK